METAFVENRWFVSTSWRVTLEPLAEGGCVKVETDP
jgi:hypothetical protein